MTDERIEALNELVGSVRNVFSEEERAAIKFTESLTAWPNSIQASDLEELGRYFHCWADQRSYAERRHGEFHKPVQ